MGGNFIFITPQEHSQIMSDVSNNQPYFREEIWIWVYPVQFQYTETAAERNSNMIRMICYPHMQTFLFFIFTFVVDILLLL